jgi:cellulose synthase/poly-beta-1,6-N-acetylglucosamine synthase-like glycosyltransferase
MISVIVCTYNRSKTLNKMINSFLCQRNLDPLAYEFLVVDNNSTDDTRDVVNSYITCGNLRYLFIGRQGLSFARNYGVQESKGDIIAFLDDDVIVEADWLTALQSCYEKTNAHFVGGRTYLVFECPPPEWFGPEFISGLTVDFGMDRKFLSNCDKLFGVNLSMRKSIVQRAGGFDVSLGRRGSELLCGEETDLTRRCLSFLPNPIIVYEPKAAVGHVVSSDRITWDYFLRHATGLGRSIEACEPKNRLPRQIARVGKSLIDYGFSWLTAMHKRRTPFNAYEKKLAEYQFVRSRSHLGARWNRLKSCIL